MNPSTSSNAESAHEVAAFKVSMRQLTPDLDAAGPEYDPRELGQLTASQLNLLLAKLATFTPDRLLDADPHLVVSGRRGRFIVRPSRGKLRLFDANDNTRDPLEIGAGEVANYLDGSELKPVEAAVDISGGTPDANNTRMGLVIGLLLLSVTMVGASAYFTFKPTTIDSDVTYTAIAPDQASAFRQQFTGTFSTGTGDGSRMLILRADGNVRFIEHGADHAIVDERNDTYQLALRENTPVARTLYLGPIDLRDAKTLFYAGEVYTRQP